MQARPMLCAGGLVLAQYVVASGGFLRVLFRACRFAARLAQQAGNCAQCRVRSTPRRAWRLMPKTNTAAWKVCPREIGANRAFLTSYIAVSAAARVVGIRIALPESVSTPHLDILAVLNHAVGMKVGARRRFGDLIPSRVFWTLRSGMVAGGVCPASLANRVGDRRGATVGFGRPPKVEGWCVETRRAKRRRMASTGFGDCPHDDSRPL